MIGTHIGPYELLEEIGQGGMATVYRAYQASVGRHVAVKVIHKSITNTHDEVSRAITMAQGGQMRLLSAEDLSTMRRIDESAEIADRAFAQFRRMQTQQGMQPADFAAAKRELRQRLDALNDELNRYLAGEYGVDTGKKKAFEAWQASHKPFHWFVEFYGILKEGGFDVIIGNPPWKEYAAAKKEYTARNYAVESCGNLYGMCTERALTLRTQTGRQSFIVQLPMASSSRMATARNLLRHASSSLHVIPFDDRPGKLFEGLEHCRSIIFLSQGHTTSSIRQFATTRYQRWPTEGRKHLLTLLEYAITPDVPIYPDQFPKYANALQISVFRKVATKGDCTIAAALSKKETEHFIFYLEATGYWVKATTTLPYYAKNGAVGAPAHGRFLHSARVESAKAICALLNSSLFYTYFLAYGDGFHLSGGLVSSFPISLAILKDNDLADLSKRLMVDLKANAERKTIATKGGDEITYDEYYGWRSKPIIDEIDRVLARHYGFTDEELDFIINYDIKYRMGRDAGDEEEEE